MFVLVPRLQLLSSAIRRVGSSAGVFYNLVCPALGAGSWSRGDRLPVGKRDRPPMEFLLMDKELSDRSEAIQQRILQLRDSL